MKMSAGWAGESYMGPVYFCPVLYYILSLQSAIIGDNHPGDDSPRDNLPTESTPGGNPPPRLGVLIQTDPRRGFPNPSRPTGRGIICKLTLTRISDPNQPTTWGPDPNPNRPTGRELSEN